MTPLAHRVMEKVRQRDHGTYERWIGAIVDATLDEAAKACRNVARDAVQFQIQMGADRCGDAILDLKEST